MANCNPSLPSRQVLMLPQSPRRFYLSKQHGATLIIVLLFLVLVMLAGAIAVRRSVTDMRVATSQQISTQLLQSSESANERLEGMINGKPSSQGYQDLISLSGAFGHFLVNPDNLGNEFIYCYNPTTTRYLTSKATIKTPSGGYWSGLNNGICDYKKSDSFTTKRNTVMTQVHVTAPRGKPSDEDEAFAYTATGVEATGSSSRKTVFNIYATSILPSYAKPVNGSTKCMEQPTAVNANGITPMYNCLIQAAVPTAMTYEQVTVENMSNAKTCYDYGKSGALANDCK